MRRRDGCKCAAILAQQLDRGRRNDQEASALIVRMLAPDYDSLLDMRGQFAAYRCARTDIQQKELFQRQRLSRLFRISDLNDYIEIDNGLEKRELQSFKFSYLFQSSE